MRRSWEYFILREGLPSGKEPWIFRKTINWRLIKMRGLGNRQKSATQRKSEYWKIAGIPPLGFI